MERTQYNFGAFATLRDRLNNDLANILDPHEKTYGLRAGVSHSLRRDLTGNIEFTASKADEFNGDDRIFEADAGITYAASQTLSFYLTTSVINRESNSLIGFPNGNLTDVNVTVGVSKSF